MAGPAERKPTGSSQGASHAGDRLGHPERTWTRGAGQPAVPAPDVRLPTESDAMGPGGNWPAPERLVGSPGAAGTVDSFAPRAAVYRTAPKQGPPGAASSSHL